MKAKSTNKLIKDYESLKHFFNALESKKTPSHSLNKLYNEQMISGHSGEFKVILALAVLEIPTIKGLEQFRTNRYFLDSLQIDLVPDFEAILLVVEDIFLKMNITESNTKKISKIEAVEEALRNMSLALIDKIKEEPANSIYHGFSTPTLNATDFNFFLKKGYLIVRSAFSDKLADSTREILLQFAHDENKAGRAYFYGSGKMQRIYHLITKHDIFRQLILHPTVRQFNDYLFDRDTLHDKYYLSSWHSNILYPKAEAQVLHIDANVPDPIPEWVIRGNASFLLEDFTQNNGATICVPGSHKWLKKPVQGDESGVQLKPLEAPKGSLVFWHGHLWHKSGPNNSNKKRVALLGCFSASFLREMCMEENPFTSVSSTVAAEFSYPLKRLLGWNHGLKQGK